MSSQPMKHQRIDIYKTEKRIRAEVVWAYMKRCNIAYAVCFSCGNASLYLREAGVPLLDISPHGDLMANRWFTMEEIRQRFPQAFDATSGHLPADLMEDIAERLKKELKFNQETEYIIPTGSGESVICLKMAFPHIKFVPEYNNNDSATEYNDNAPLNSLVRAMFKRIIMI